MVLWILGGVLPLLAWAAGYERGEADTEKRWSEAVARADDWRAREAERR